MSRELSLLGRALLENLPRAGLKYVCLYGSKVLEGKASARSQLDALIGVEENYLPMWHKENLSRNRNHYSAIPRTLGPSIVMILQDLSAGVYFNLFVKIHGHPSTEFKYGVFSYETLIKDLTNWNTFYLAGRLQKPVLPIFPQADRFPEDIKVAVSKNLRMALAISMIILADEFSEEQVFETVAGLSYSGDLRVGIAENPNKVRNIVFGGNNLDHFRELYRDSIEYFLRTSLIRRTTHGYETCPATTPYSFMSLLPAEFHTLDPRTDVKGHVVNVLRQKNRSFSQSQSLKGFVTAGPLRSTSYAIAKLRKRFEGQAVVPTLGQNNRAAMSTASSEGGWTFLGVHAGSLSSPLHPLWRDFHLSHQPPNIDVKHKHKL